MNIRAITTGINLSRASNTAKIRKVAQFSDRARKAFMKNGITVQTLRMTTQPWPQYCSGFSHMKIIERIKSIEYMAKEQGIDFVSIGYVRSAPAIKMIPDIIAATDRVSASVVIADRVGMHYKSITGAAQAIRSIAKKTSRGYGNFRFAALAQCPPNIPFYPASYHKGNMCFTLALECSDLLVSACSIAKDLVDAERVLTRVLEREFRKLQGIATKLSRSEGLEFRGIDVSPAPSVKRNESLVYAFQKLGVGTFGGPGTLAVAGMLTTVLRSLDIRKCGYCGLMLPVLEDYGLAHACSRGMFDIDTLLAYSAVCGTGLDCIPLPGDIPAKKIYAILLDVATLAVKLQKPLSARLFPVPGKKKGEMTHFKSPYLVDCRILHVK